MRLISPCLKAGALRRFFGKLPRPIEDGAFSSPQDNILPWARQYLGASKGVYKTPQSSDIFRSIHISITYPAAGQVQARTPFALPMTYHVATMTGFRGVARLYTLHGYANLHALVGKELAKLIERPAITASPFSPRTGQFVRAFSDAGEIVNCDGLICRLSLLDESITEFTARIIRYWRLFGVS
jgi:hypothetical protein